MHELLIIRHGESTWNLERRWQGWRDAPLTERGEAQALARARDLALTGVAPRVVHCSDLGRARRTAEIIAAALGVATRPDAGFRERRGGEWEGLTAADIDERWPGERAAWRRGELNGPPGGEEDAAVLARFDDAVARVIEPDGTAVLVTHHGVLRLVARRAGVDIRAVIPNLGGFWFDVIDGVLARPRPLDGLPAGSTAPAVE